MDVNRGRPTMKSRIRQVDFRQNQDHDDKEEQTHEHEPRPRAYRPAFHGTDANTNFNRIKPHKSAMRLRLWVVDGAYTARTTIMLASS